MNDLILSLSYFSKAGAKAPARGGLGAKPSALHLWGLLADPLLAGHKRYKNGLTSQPQTKITQPNPQQHPRNIKTLPYTSHSASLLLPSIILSLSLILFSSCSTSSHRDQHILRVLDREEDVLTAIKKDRTKAELTEAIAPNPTLTNSEMRLFEALTELQEANKLVRTALEKETKEKK